MTSDEIIKEIEKLENRNRFLLNDSSKLNNNNITQELKKRIDGNIEEIEKNKQIINYLKTEMSK